MILCGLSPMWEEPCNNSLCPKWGVHFQQLCSSAVQGSAVQCSAVVTELGLQWVISPRLCLFSFRRSSDLTLLLLLLLATTASSHIKNPTAHGLPSNWAPEVWPLPSRMLMTTVWSGLCEPPLIHNGISKQVPSVPVTYTHTDKNI